ncbi:MAG: DMT family transporter [Gammaproteobacteria bacterium]|nr:DMT family transporter [Gammaproteobacteria bacterium]
MSWLLAPLAMLCGVFVTTQIASNTLLGESLGNLYLPAAVNMLVGFCFTSVLVWAVTDTAPAAAMIRAAPWWTWIAGGLLGTMYLTGSILLAPKLGAAALIGFVVSGQLIWGVLLDHFGWIGFEQHDASVARLIGCGLLLGGVFLIAKF